MSYEKRRRSGPLTERQRVILEGLSRGKRQQQIANELGVTASYISAEACVLVAKMGCTTTQGAAARYGSYRANLAAAELLLKRGVIAVPIDDTEIHVNHVIRDLAAELRRRAERLLGS